MCISYKFLYVECILYPFIVNLVFFKCHSLIDVDENLSIASKITKLTSILPSFVLVKSPL